MEQRMGERRMGAGIAAVLLASALALGGCGGNVLGAGGVEGELLDALRTKELKSLCVEPSLLGVDAFEGQDGRHYVAKAGDFSFLSSGSSVHALAALQAKGYVSREATSMPRGLGSAFDAFAITDAGAKYFQPDAFGTGIDVCVGEKNATDILEYTEPGKEGPQAIQARFRYEVELNDLASDLGVEKELAAEIARVWPGEGVAAYVKTNKGWRLEHAMWQ